MILYVNKMFKLIWDKLDFRISFQRDFKFHTVVWKIEERNPSFRSGSAKKHKNKENLVRTIKDMKLFKNLMWENLNRFESFSLPCQKIGLEMKEKSQIKEKKWHSFEWIRRPEESRSYVFFNKISSQAFICSLISPTKIAKYFINIKICDFLLKIKTAVFPQT